MTLGLPIIRTSYDPAKFLLVFPPSDQARSREQASRFAQSSGWQALAEYDGAVLVIPIAPAGWQQEDVDLPGQLYDALRNQFPSRNGHSLLGRGSKLWCWETLIYLVGYGDGADFAGDSLVAHPNRFAAAALVGGAPRHFAAGQNTSSHWLVPQVSEGYCRKNCQIPSCLWMLGAPEEAAGLPLVFSVHGRGEPAWLFATKNGWDTLADETPEFVLPCRIPPGTSGSWTGFWKPLAP